MPISTRTKIVCTIGPACESKELIKRLADAGMDMCRLNLSHGTIEEHQIRFNRIRKLLPTTPILMDLEGPRVRIGDMENAVNLQEGDHIILTTEELLGTKEKVSVSLKVLHRLVTPGQSIFINDGIIELRVEEIRGNEIQCVVFAGGIISSNKGVNVPGVDLELSVPTPQDIEHLRFITTLGPEFVAVSTVKHQNELKQITEFLQNEGFEIPLIAKIEHRLGIVNFDNILAASAGIMIARGDLGVEIPPEQVPLLQKEIIHKCVRAGKPVIVATQMLESMVYNSRPTRAETSDVANAILDGADAVMLSAETAIGKYPYQAVKVMSTIARQVEGSYPMRDSKFYDSGRHLIAEELGKAVVSITENLNIDIVLVFTMGGYTARMVSKYRPPARIIAATPNVQVQRQLRILWGVETLLVEHYENTDELLQDTIKRLVKKKVIQKDDRFVVVQASQLVPGKTNLLGVFTVEDILHSKISS